MYVYLPSTPPDRLERNNQLPHLPCLFTVGFFDPRGTWHPESDHDTAEAAAARVAYLNGAAAVHRTLGEALNSGSGSYHP